MRTRLNPAAIIGALLTSGASAQCPPWQPAPIVSDPSGATAYDSRRNTLVCVGGVRDDGYYTGETWEYANRRWSIASVIGPRTRGGAGAAFDTTRGVTVLFGGSMNGVYFTDTWEWDGRDWTARAQSGPPPRSAAALAYDSTRRVCILFGGSLNGLEAAGDTWEWNGRDWAQRATTGAYPRMYHNLAYDSARQRTLTFGGYGQGPSGYGYLRDTWEWDGAAWAQVASTGPSTRVGAALAYDPVRQRTVLFGGYDASIPLHYNDTWEWDGNAWTQRFPVHIPEAAYSGPPRLAFDTARGKVILHMPLYNSPIPLKTWVWDGTDWTLDAQFEPGPRRGAAMVYDGARARTVLFGGYDGQAYLNDTFDRQGSRWGLVPVTGSPPSPRAFGAAAFDSARGVTVLFGGADSATHVLGDTWEFDGAAWTLRCSSGPPARQWHAMAYDPVRQVTVLAGGWDGGPPIFGDTWEWNGIAWTQRNIPPYPNRAQLSMAYDEARSRMVIFGGATGASFLGDTWTSNGAGWMLASTTGPTARHYASACYDPLRQRIVLFGGHDGIFRADTWEWNGAAWSNTAGDLIASRFAASMVFDESIGATLLFGGGHDEVFYNDTWEYPRAAPTIETSPPPHLSVPLGHSVSLVTNSIGGSPQNPLKWRQDGVLLAGGVRPVLDLTPAADAEYDAVLSTPCGQATSAPTHIGVIAPCRANCDGSTASPPLNIADFACFLQRFAAGEPYANCDHSNTPPVHNIADLACFLQEFAAGCP